MRRDTIHTRRRRPRGKSVGPSGGINKQGCEEDMLIALRKHIQPQLMLAAIQANHCRVNDSVGDSVHDDNNSEAEPDNDHDGQDVVQGVDDDMELPLNLVAGDAERR